MTISKSQKERLSPKVLLMAHRGGEGEWPSNTIYAFQQAAALGADVLELDIHTSKDGVLMVRHDPFVESTSDGRGYICELTLAEIKRLDAGYTWTGDGGQSFPFRGLGITIPTLEEVLQAFPAVRLNIDIKPEDPAVVAAFVALLRKYDKIPQVMVGSFHDRQLRLFRRMCPEAETAAGVRETLGLFLLNKIGLGALYRAKAQAFQIPECYGWLRVVTPGFIRAAHAHGMQVHVWTVDEEQDMRRLIDWGVDGIITDYPGRLREVLDGMAE
jgi:glycerophosphoryl diester phosphodiesterase